MERSREIKRAASSAPRRLRISCPKDPADAEARMDDTPLIEKVKKGNLQAFPASFPETATAWTKRKRHGFQETHNLSEGSHFGKDFLGSTPSDEYDDEAIHGAVDRKQRAKKDELVMNICNIPRRARSSATRVPFRQPVPTFRQRSPSPRILVAKEEKLRQVGMKSRLLKDLGVMESEQVSDQEVEIAGVLFNLSRSLPQSTSLTCDKKPCRGLEEEEFNSSSSQIAEQKSKRQRVFEKQEESLCMPSAERVNANAGCCISELPVSVMEGIQVDELECFRGAASKLFCEQPGLRTRDIVKEPCHEEPQFDVADDKNANYTEERGQEHKTLEVNQTHFAEQIYNQDSLGLSSLSINKSEFYGQAFDKGGDCSKISSRRSHKGSEGSGMNSRPDMRSLSENCIGKVICTNHEKANQGKIEGAPVMDESRSGTNDVPRWNQELPKAALSPGKGDQKDSRLLDVKNENTAMPDLCKGQETFSGVSSPSMVHPSPTTFMGWTGAFPQLGLNKKAGPSWLTNCLHSGSSSYQAELPHATISQHPVRRMRRCATHVHIAHFIQQQEQFLRRPFWPPVCNPHNLSLSTANLQGKEHWSNKIPSLQAEHRHTWAESIGTRMPNSRSTVNSTKNEGYSNSAHVLSAGAGIKKGCGDLKSMMNASQLKQNTLHSSGPSTIRLSLNGGSPAQNASNFNKGLYSAHVSSQNLAQQASGLLKCQQGNHASLNVGLSHLHSTQPQAQMQQVQCEQLKQQRSCLTPPPQLYGAGSGTFLEGNRLGFR